MSDDWQPDCPKCIASKVACDEHYMQALATRDEIAALVKRLKGSGPRPFAQEAADALTALQAENERLRKALEPFADAQDTCEKASKTAPQLDVWLFIAARLSAAPATCTEARENRMNKHKPIICLDFDGVIHSYSSGWRGAAKIPDGLVEGAIDAILSYLDAGFTVAIYSSRSKSLFGRWAMKRRLGEWIAEHWERSGSTSPSYAECECWGDAAGIVGRISWPWFKPAALVTIDDRALTFNGTWSSPEYQPSAIRSFKPWNKQ